jgi:hypothetical protein
MNGTLDVMAAVQSGDVEKLRALLAAEPSLAAAQDGSRVSAIMHALYRRRKDMADLLITLRPEIDIFEATAAGRSAR